jgi:hypothetical protein
LVRDLVPEAYNQIFLLGGGRRGSEWKNNQSRRIISAFWPTDPSVE